LIYTNLGVVLLALTSNALHKLWIWKIFLRHKINKLITRSTFTEIHSKLRQQLSIQITVEILQAENQQLEDKNRTDGPNLRQSDHPSLSRSKISRQMENDRYDQQIHQQPQIQHSRYFCSQILDLVLC